MKAKTTISDCSFISDLFSRATNKSFHVFIPIKSNRSLAVKGKLKALIRQNSLKEAQLILHDVSEAGKKQLIENSYSYLYLMTPNDKIVCEIGKIQWQGVNGYLDLPKKIYLLERRSDIRHYLGNGINAYLSRQIIHKDYMLFTSKWCNEKGIIEKIFPIKDISIGGCCFTIYPQFDLPGEQIINELLSFYLYFPMDAPIKIDLKILWVKDRLIGAKYSNKSEFFDKRIRRVIQQIMLNKAV